MKKINYLLADLSALKRKVRNVTRKQHACTLKKGEVSLTGVRVCVLLALWWLGLPERLVLISPSKLFNLCINVFGRKMVEFHRGKIK